LDSDRDFGHVEVAVKRRQNIYTVDEYHDIIANSTRNPKPVVTRMGDKMVDVTKLCQSLNLYKKTVDDDGNKIELRDKVRWIKMNQFGSYCYKHSLTEEEAWKKVTVHRGDPTSVTPIIEVLTTLKLPIKKAKFDDLKKQLKFVPEIYHGLYLSLASASDASVESDGSVTGDGNDDDDCAVPCTVRLCLCLPFYVMMR
jgi:hypothetical protein